MKVTIEEYENGGGLHSFIGCDICRKFIREVKEIPRLDFRYRCWLEGSNHDSTPIFHEDFINELGE